MRIKSLYLICLLTLSSVSNCEKFGLLGQGGVPGSTAKTEIEAAANTSATLVYTTLCSSSSLSSSKSQCLSLASIGVIIEKILVPITAKISSSKHYTRSSVDDCKSKVMTIGFLISGPGLSGITCNLKETPKVIQIGESGL
ncbi:MAG TPA: TIGR04452 family lipoprotein [Leptospiraceae bacterium]|nr:TIGR04452 family lipoprotein [Leptospiraceae bacterium]HNF16865.1 TIGR04452 family lipoprotein [Leptospiraceae bacterium]HNF27635.1 TIGR04452 family lipoprotein [Leptospiraceae bacterium]HNH10045.1 TIGR04452 family lipoprotein [Leptospiraceae bacterium]HNI97422.1 TIGR04452 family lipoprotein [Leptospiraceae bacterium]